MLAVSSSLMNWNICSDRSGSQLTAKSATGTPHVRPLSPLTRVIASAHWARAKGDVPSLTRTARAPAMLSR